MRFAALVLVTALLTALGAVQQNTSEPSSDELLLQAAGLKTDADSLLAFFHDRARPQADAGKLLELAQKLADPDARVRAQTASELIACGTSAIPTLRHVLNDLVDPVAAEQAQRCLEWLEGNQRTALPTAAARLLAQRRPSGAAAALLDYLPFADDRSVVDGVKAALVTLAKAAGKPEPALVKALRDPVPLRRAIAVEVLCTTDLAEVLPNVQELLGDAKPQVRLRAALALAQKHDEKAIGVLIDLLAELPPVERRLAEEALQQLAGDLAPNPALVGDDDLSRKIRRGAWAAWWQATDGPALLAAFRKQTLSPADQAQALKLIEQLGDKSFPVRERAAADLIALGPKVAALVREATASPDLERAQRARLCLKQIDQTADRHQVPSAAARLLAIRKPAGATAALLAYLPFTEDESMKSEVGKALKQLAMADGKPDPVLVKTLADVLPIRRAAAAEALAAAGATEHFPALRKLFEDPDSAVRLRVAVALACARDKEAVPVLIDLAAELPAEKAWQAETLLRRLAGDKAPDVALGADAAACKQFRDQWTAWWKKHEATADLALLAEGPSTLGITLVTEFAIQGQPGFNPQPGGFGGGKKGGKAAKGAVGGKVAGGKGQVFGGTDRVIEVDRNGNVLWHIDNLQGPVDAHVLPGNRVLIAECNSGRVTERDFKGTILWQANSGNQFQGNPANAQRLANGNTFIATMNGHLVELNKDGVALLNVFLNMAMQAAYKCADGQIVCLTQQGVCQRLDATGKEIKRFNIGQQPQFLGAIDVTPKGHLLVADGISMVKEYDANGKIVWQTTTPNTSATRLVNGHTLVASYNAAGVAELDSGGNVVWEYQPVQGYRPWRARQR